MLSSLRRWFYKFGLLPSYKLAVPVIVVGNISVGGTGKTPLVIWLADWLKQQGLRPGIISRGFGGKANALLPVDANSDPSIVGDEPVLLARRTQCPVWVGRNRSAVGKALLATHPDCNVLISDDGLQHYALRRDVEIAVVDGSRGFGNGWLLPAGPLRELPSRLEIVDTVVCNGAKSVTDAWVMQLRSTGFHNLLEPTKTATTADFSGQHLYAVAGIGNPQRFFEQLRSMDLQFESQAYPDHYAFQPADLQFKDAEAILMTEKDAVKCMAFAQSHWWYLQVDAEVDEVLGQRIMQKLRKLGRN
jgi:tetraacyldisaccharide 4'-kinase